MADTEARLKALEKEKGGAEARVAELEKALSAEKASAGNVAKRGEEQLKGAQEKLEASGKEQARLQKQLADTEARLKALEKEKGAAVVRGTGLEKSLADTEAQRKGLEKEKAAVSARLAELEKAFSAEKANAVRLASRYNEEGLVRQGKALREQVDDLNNPALVWSLNDAGLLYLAEGKLDRAEEMFRRALVIMDNTSGRVNVSAGTLLQNLADIAWRKDNMAGADSLYKESAQAFALALGTSHPRYAAVLNSWASVLRAQQKYPDAEKMYRQAIGIYERTGKGLPVDLAVPAHNLALMLMEQGRLDEAGPLLERALSLVERQGPADARALVLMRTMSRYYRAIGDMEQSARYDERANELSLKALMH